MNTKRATESSLSIALSAFDTNIDPVIFLTVLMYRKQQTQQMDNQGHQHSVFVWVSPKYGGDSVT